MREQILIGSAVLSDHDARALQAAAVHIHDLHAVFIDPPALSDDVEFPRWAAEVAFISAFRDCAEGDTVMIGEDDYGILWQVVTDSLRYAESARVRELLAQHEVKAVLPHGVGASPFSFAEVASEQALIRREAEKSAAAIRALLIRASAQGMSDGSPW